MAKLTLQGCKHGPVKLWDDEDVHGTCMVCYERLRKVEGNYTATGGFRLPPESWTRDTPAPFCLHRDKETIVKPPKFRHYTDHIDALCLDCGVVLRHPEGPGEWEEVVFNGYRIKEEP